MPLAFRKAGLVFLASVSALSVGIAHAQNAPAAEAQSQDEPAADHDGLQEIIVTAQKRAQNVQDVPIAITAILGAQLESAGIARTEDLKSAFAGVNIRTTSVALQPSIRGIGTGTVNVENPVGFYIDGVYYANQSDASRELNDIEQVAVLKGPQGTLFGRNATAGVIQITTRAPSHHFGGQFTASLDNYATLHTGLYLTGGLTNDIAASVSANFTTQGNGWGENIADGSDIYKIFHNVSVRGKLLFTPDDLTEITLIADYMDRKDNVGQFYRPFPGTNFSPLLPYQKLGSVHDANVNESPMNLFKGGGVSATAARDLGWGRLQSITAYRGLRSGYISDVDSTPVLGYRLNTTYNNAKSFSEELQLTSNPGSKVNWAAGIYYFHYRNSLEPVVRTYAGALFAPLPTSFAQRVITSSEEANSIAPFGQVDFEVLPATRITVGGRWTYEKRVLNGTFSGTLVNGTDVPAIIPPIKDASLTARKPTWRVALDHKFSETVLGYISYNSGFKSGGFNITNLLNPAYQPERLDAYEAGLKTELFDRRLRLNATGFYYKYQNLQVLQLIGGANTVTNGAAAELYGLDVDFEARLSPELRINGGFELLHTEFSSYPNAAISTPLPAGGVAVALGDATGNQLPGAQKFNGNISATYTRATPIGEVELNATFNHNSSYFFEADNFTKQKAYDLVNLSVDLTPDGSPVKIGLFVRNLLDEQVISQASAFAGLGYVTTYDNPPRRYGVQTRLEF